MGFLSSLFGPKRPPHMKGQHIDSVKKYYELREKIGDPFSQDPIAVLSKVLKLEFSLNPSVVVNDETNFMSDLGYDELGVVEISLLLEDLYDGRLNFPDWPDGDLSSLTVGEFVESIREIL